METEMVTEYARALYSAHGDKAEAEAAQRARQLREAGNEKEARDWQAVRSAIRQMRGPNES